MRAIFVLLLIANLLFFGWIMSGQDAADGRPDIAETPGVETITLLDEVATGQAEADPGEATELAAQPVEAVEPQPEVAEKPQLEPRPKAEPMAEKKPAAEPEVAAVSQPATQPVTDSCHTMGPFRDLTKLRGIIKAVKDEVVEASFRSREETEQTLFWVYLKPEADLDGARATTRKLRQKKVKDSYIIPDGDKQFGISLGHFKEKPRAYTLRDRIARLGFEPRVDPVFRTYTIFWLDYRLTAGKDNASLLEGLELDSSINQFDRACS